MAKQKESRSDPAERRGLRVSVHVRGELPADEVKAFVERRVRFALARFGHVIKRARIDIAPQQDEVVCHLQLHGAGEPPISVRAADADRTIALSSAIERAIHELARRLRGGRSVIQRTDATSTS